MNNTKASLFLFLFFIQSVMVIAAPTEVETLTIERVLPENIQFTWDVSDTAGLTKIEIYQDEKLIFEKDLAKTRDADIYQIEDDEKNHDFEFVVYNAVGMETRIAKTLSDDDDAPVLTCPSRIISNEKKFSCTTNELAICKYGKNQNNLTALDKEYVQNHTVELEVSEGLNRILMQCFDKEENIMAGLASVEFVYDTKGPSEVKSLTGEGNRLTWEPAEDPNGIDYYNIYNEVKNIASTYQTYWDATSEDSTYYVAAIDKAGNEGKKTEVNLQRARLLASNSTIIESGEEKENAAGKKGIDIKLPPMNDTINTGLVILGIFILLFIAIKIYEHKTDPHGLKKYIKHRRKMRDLHAKEKL